MLIAIVYSRYIDISFPGGRVDKVSLQAMADVSGVEIFETVDGCIVSRCGLARDK